MADYYSTTEDDEQDRLRKLRQQMAAGATAAPSPAPSPTPSATDRLSQLQGAPAPQPPTTSLPGQTPTATVAGGSAPKPAAAPGGAPAPQPATAPDGQPLWSITINSRQDPSWGLAGKNFTATWDAAAGAYRLGADHPTAAGRLVDAAGNILTDDGQIDPTRAVGRPEDAWYWPDLQQQLAAAAAAGPQAAPGIFTGPSGMVVLDESGRPLSSDAMAAIGRGYGTYAANLINSGVNSLADFDRLAGQTVGGAAAGGAAAAPPPAGLLSGGGSTPATTSVITPQTGGAAVSPGGAPPGAGTPALDIGGAFAASSSAPAGSPPDWYSAWWNTIQNRPDFGAVVPEMPASVAGLNDQLAQFASQGLQTPGRYDTELFNQLLDIGLEKLNQQDQKARLDLMRDSLRRLGPNSGQLSNEYIDLEAEMARQRNELLAGLAREAATTNAQDRLAALQGAMSVGGQLFDQAAGLRGEQRAERAFQQGDYQDQLAQLAGFANMDRLLGRDAMDDYYRQLDAETNINESKARIAQGDFQNWLALANLYFNAPAGIGGTPASATAPDWGGPVGAPSTDQVRNMLQKMTPAEQQQLAYYYHAANPKDNTPQGYLPDVTNLLWAVYGGNDQQVTTKEGRQLLDYFNRMMQKYGGA